MKFKKLFSLSAFCLVGVMGVGLLGACDTEDEDADICTGEDCSTGDEEAGETDGTEPEKNQVSITLDEGLYTFSGTINLGLGTTVSGEPYYGDVDIPTTLTIGVYDDEHYTVWLDCEIPIVSVSLSVLSVKLTGYGGDAINTVETSHLSFYYDSEEGNVYYHRADTGSGGLIDGYEVWGEFEQSEFLKNPLFYITRDMFGCGERIFDGVGDIISNNPLDVDSLLSSLSSELTSNEIISGDDTVIGNEYSLNYDAGAPEDVTSAVGKVNASISIYDDHSKDAISIYIPTYFTVSLGVFGSYNLIFDMSIDLAIETSESKGAISEAFSEIEGYISENASHFVLNTVTDETHEVEGEVSYTYTGSAPIETTLEVGTYTDENEETQYTYLLDCEIPIVTVQFASSQLSTIKLTGYGNGVLSNSVTTSHLTAYYDTGEGVICWHRIDTGSNSAFNKTLDTYENWGAFEQEEFAKNPYYYITHDFFGCGQRIYQEAVEAIDEESIVGSDIVDITSDEISAALSSVFVWSSNNLKFDLDVDLSKDNDAGTEDSGELISGFVSYINGNPTHFVLNSIVEDSYLSTSVVDENETNEEDETLDSVTVSEQEYSSVVAYTGYITLALTNIDIID